MVATRSSKSPDINVGKSSKSVTFDTDVLKPKMRTKSIPTGMKKGKKRDVDSGSQRKSTSKAKRRLDDSVEGDEILKKKAKITIEEPVVVEKVAVKVYIFLLIFHVNMLLFDFYLKKLIELFKHNSLFFNMLG